jgi:two-component sensor histidine kinase
VIRKLSLRLRLALLVAGTALPLIIFSAVIVYLNFKASERSAAERTVQGARALAAAVDRELQSTAAALQVLALSEPLRAGDLAGFRRQADAFLRRQHPDSNLVLIDRNGDQVLNMRQDPDAPLPKVAALDTVRKVFATGRPIVSDYRISPLRGRPIVTVDVPVEHDGGVAYDLSYSPTLALFGEVIRQQQPEPDWTVAIFDRAGITIARAPNPEQFVGRPASPTLLSVLLARRDGVVDTTTHEGTRALTAFTEAPVSGWRVAIGVPRHSLSDPLWWSLAATVAIGLGLLAVGLAFAIGMAKRMARAESHRELLINELNHRVKNTLMTVQSIATRTLRHAPNHAEARTALEARLIALSRTHNVLTEQKWENAALREIVTQILDPYLPRDRARLDLSGPDLRVKPRAALTLAMVLHELATNAAKYGALSNADGRLSVRWTIAGDAQGPRLRLTWTETGGPEVQVPQRRGFGSSLIERSVAHELRGTGNLDYDQGGLIYRLDVPLGALQAAGAEPAAAS